MFYTILLAVQVLVAVSLIGLILLQHGKGADAGAAFGSGASGTVFGAQGSANFLSRVTAALATVFFAVSLSLAYLVSGNEVGSDSVVEQIEAPGSELLNEDKPKASDDAGGDGAPSPDTVPE